MSNFDLYWVRQVLGGGRGPLKPTVGSVCQVLQEIQAAGTGRAAARRKARIPNLDWKGRGGGAIGSPGI